jgi:hypothetical protein
MASNHQQPEALPQIFNVTEDLLTGGYQSEAPQEMFNVTEDMLNGGYRSEALPGYRFEEPPQEMFNVAEQEDVPPNGGYGWVCVGCVFLINAHTWGINSVSSCHYYRDSIHTF